MPAGTPAVPGAAVPGGEVFNRRCVIKGRQRTGAVDAWGADTGEYTYTPRCTDTPWRVEGLSFAEEEDGRELVEATHRGFFAAGTDVRNTDRIEDEDGTEFDVLWVNTRPGGTRHHVEVRLREVA